MREVIQSPLHDRNRSLGWLAIWWIENFCVHGPGDIQGDSVILDDEFAGYIVDVYALDTNGRRLYIEAFLSRAKGRAKSELAAFIAMFEAFGPCRFSHWSDGTDYYEYRGQKYFYQKGDPVGRPVIYPFIRCLATEESQAGNTYDNIYYNLSEGILSDGLGSRVAGVTRILLPGGGEIVPSSASNSSKDGGKETHVVFDETHLYILPELKNMHKTVTRNLDKRKAAEPWGHNTSTMYLPGQNSVAEDTHTTAKEMLAGKLRKPPRLFFDHRSAPNGVDFEDESAVMDALREAYGPFADVMDLDRILESIYDPRNALEDSQRYFFNQPTSAEDAWLRYDEWWQRHDADKIVKDRDFITLGFDGSRARKRGIPDATALIGCRVSDGHVFTIKVWEPPKRPEFAKDWQAPVEEVDATVRAAFKRFNVVGFFADPTLWESYIAAWTKDFGRKLKVAVTKEHPIEFWPVRVTAVVRAVASLHAAIVTGDMTHDGSAELSEHVLNARRNVGRSGVLLRKINPQSPKKIDAAYAAAMAWAARMECIANGVGIKKTGGIKRLR